MRFLLNHHSGTSHVTNFIWVLFSSKYMQSTFAQHWEIPAKHLPVFVRIKIRKRVWVFFCIGLTFNKIFPHNFFKVFRGYLDVTYRYFQQVAENGIPEII